MLVIRQSQMLALQDEAARAFEDRMMLHLAQAFPVWYAERGELRAREFIRRGVDNGFRHGIRSQAAVQVLLELTTELGEQFERSEDPAWAELILAHPSLPGFLKLDLIRKRFGNLAGDSAAASDASVE